MPGETELEGPKDLRAGLRKYLRPTNERKQMSTKTIKQRIAVVAVSALTAGLFSVVSAPVANAAIAARDLLGVTTASSTNFGILSVTNTSSSATSYEMLASGQLALVPGAVAETAATNGDYCKYTISQGNGSFTYATDAADVGGGATAIDGAASDVAADGQSATWTSNGTDTRCGAALYFKPGATGKVVILYTKKVGAAVSTVETITIVVVASASASTAGALSLANSLISKEATGTAATDNVDNSTDNLANGSIGYIGIDLKDAYYGDVASGAIVVKATNGALVNYGADPTSTSTSTVVAADAGSSDWVAVSQAIAGVPVTTTVTIEYNGTLVGSRTFTITGDLAKLSISNSYATGLAINPSNAVTATGFLAFAYDSAGNQIGWAVAPDTAKYTPLVTAVTVTTPTTTAAAGVAGGWTCANASGSTPIRIKGTTLAGATIYSNEVSAACGGAVYNYTASLDKASYVPGDVATLTIKATDSNKAAVSDSRTVGANVAIAGSNMTPVGTIAAGDTFAWGTKTYKFVVGSTEGSYQMTVDLPAYAATDSAKTVAYKIAASTATVSNADVLKSIVALIASINKQIQALQKLILRR